MQRVKEEVNKNSKYTYDWFKEETGDHHWVLYNTDMYEISNCGIDRHLHYIELSELLPMVPINATSCHHMFDNCCDTKELDFKHFNTENIITMEGMFSKCNKISKLNLKLLNTTKVTNMFKMFSKCRNLEELGLNSFSTANVADMGAMFTYCSKLTQLDFTLFDTRNVTDTRWMFEHCEKLTTIFISDKWSMDRVTNAMDMFKECCSLPGFSPEKTGIEMAKPTEQGGYLTLKK